ncbi:hypothetical protein [Tautonia marina]|uniref:hypothetical protein n=1 Tax=Tautonia marina TaxID=2653855 RepID=UPI0012608E2F|nr:hypothetical protein [Tautonia marina]
MTSDDGAGAEQQQATASRSIRQAADCEAVWTPFEQAKAASAAQSMPRIAITAIQGTRRR